MNLIDLEKYQETLQSHIDKQKNEFEYYQYSSKSKSQLNLSSKFIRLPNASGIWLMEKISINSTKLTYLWNCELLGNIPKWVLPKAWKKQGTEILLELEEALKYQLQRLEAMQKISKELYARPLVGRDVFY